MCIQVGKGAILRSIVATAETVFTEMKAAKKTAKAPLTAGTDAETKKKV